MNPRFFDSFPVVQTERVLLREPTAEDAAAVFDAFADDEVTRYYDVETMTSPAEARELVEKMRGKFQSRSGIRWAIVDQRDGVTIDAAVMIGNEASARVLRKAGFQIDR